MSKALLDPDRCNPDLCPEGVCSVRRLCAVRAIYQDEPHERPLLDWSRCRACSKCVDNCPAKAIKLVN